MFPVIRSEDEYNAFLNRIDELWDATEGSQEEQELHRLAAAVESFEQAERRATLPPPRGGALIAYMLRERKMSQRELSRRLGWSSGRVSEVIHGKRSLTLEMVRCLSTELNIDPRLLVHEEAQSDADHVWLRIPAALANRLFAARGALGVSLDELVVKALSASLQQSVAQACHAAVADNIVPFPRCQSRHVSQSFSHSEAAA